MSYNDLVSTSLNNIDKRIESYKGDNNSTHEKCDYIELLALLRGDELYKNDLVIRFFREDEDRSESKNIPEEDKSAINDFHEQVLDDLFEVLLFRQMIFSENYPFEVTKDYIKLKSNFTLKTNIYIVLLCCANLTTFEHRLRNKLTEEFEQITYCALKKYLPNFQIKRLGYQNDYEGLNTRDTLLKLAQDMNIEPYRNQIDGISIYASKEKGVDLIAWHKFRDNIPNTIIFLIQCACGKDTAHKIHEPENYCTYLNLKQYQKYPIITLAVPRAVVIGENRIEQIKDFASGDSLYFDRFRLMEFCNITDDMSCIQGMQAFILADKLIDKTITILD